MKVEEEKQMGVYDERLDDALKSTRKSHHFHQVN